ncbi:hypothetical protein HG530_008737 [Fusarium avenaceum]|nr:hypothetical protein HG530_008737 [Fusarium avenaceum]
MLEAICIFPDVLAHLELKLVRLLTGALRTIFDICAILRREEPLHRTRLSSESEKVDLLLNNVSSHGADDSVNALVCLLHVILVADVSCDDFDVLGFEVIDEIWLIRHRVLRSKDGDLVERGLSIDDGVGDVSANRAGCSKDEDAFGLKLCHFGVVQDSCGRYF